MADDLDADPPRRRGLARLARRAPRRRDRRLAGDRQEGRAPESSRDEALEEALCHGWIDGQARSRDDATYLQRYTPRRARSTWSQRNVKIVERLTAEGRMHPAGLAEVERAKADGRWDAAYAGSAHHRGAGRISPRR